MKYLGFSTLKNLNMTIKKAGAHDIHVIYSNNVIELEVTVMANDIEVDQENNEIIIDTGLNEMIDNLSFSLSENERLNTYINDEWYGMGEQWVFETEDENISFYIVTE